jgi:hypothetical protein
MEQGRDRLSGVPRNRHCHHITKLNELTQTSRINCGIDIHVEYVTSLISETPDCVTGPSCESSPQALPRCQTMMVCSYCWVVDSELSFKCADALVDVDVVLVRLCMPNLRPNPFPQQLFFCPCLARAWIHTCRKPCSYSLLDREARGQCRGVGLRI